MSKETHYELLELSGLIVQGATMRDIAAEAEAKEFSCFLEDTCNGVPYWPTDLCADAFCRASVGMGNCRSELVGCKAAAQVEAA